MTAHSGRVVTVFNSTNDFRLITAIHYNRQEVITMRFLNRSIAYRILKGARNLTATHIKKLSARFAVSADLLLA